MLRTKKVLKLNQIWVLGLIMIMKIRMKKDNDVKRNFINKITKDKSYKSVWDCGANTGNFQNILKIM